MSTVVTTMYNCRLLKFWVALVPVGRRICTNTLQTGQLVPGINLLLDGQKTIVVVLAPEAVGCVRLISITLVHISTAVWCQGSQGVDRVRQILEYVGQILRCGCDRIGGIEYSLMNHVPKRVSLKVMSVMRSPLRQCQLLLQRARLTHAGVTEAWPGPPCTSDSGSL